MNVKELTIYSSNFLAQIEFYSELIGLTLLEKTSKKAKFKVGKSCLEIRKSYSSKPYHFAINIPSNKENEALKWLKSKVEILKDNDIEIQGFDNWNASAIYFYDNDNNIVEFIARKNLRNESTEKFSAKSLLEISEIGVPVTDIKKAYNALWEKADIEIYDGGFERFCAIGDETGLFICINKNVKDWFPTGDKAYSSPFEIVFEQAEKRHSLQFSAGEIKW